MVPQPETVAQPAVTGREALSMALLVALADFTIFRGQGFAGYALLFVAAPLLLRCGSPFAASHRAGLLILGMLALLAARMAWLGSGLGVAVGFVLLIAMAMALSGRTPHVLEGLQFAIVSTVTGFQGVPLYVRSVKLARLRISPVWLFSLVLPVVAVLCFGAIFVLANPELVTSFRDWANRAWNALLDWSKWLAPNWLEVAFCIAAAWVWLGLMRPLQQRLPVARFTDVETPEAKPVMSAAQLFPALRNTLLAVIGLFAVYLVFEATTLWFREFPPGFYYAGYAHEGAAWLTAALALATLVLSLIFRGAIYEHPHFPLLRRLAWIWSLENLALAIGVYNRLAIYVGFNGMTRMRTVALFGTSTVVVGFLLVVWKILHRRDMLWLLRRQLWALAAAFYLYALTPVDSIVYGYNARRVMRGDLPPAVQISVRPPNAEGVWALHPLVNSDNEIIREGIQALLAQRALAAEATAQDAGRDWTRYQMAEQRLHQRLEATEPDWAPFINPEKRAAAIERFRTLVQQWY